MGRYVEAMMIKTAGAALALSVALAGCSGVGVVLSPDNQVTRQDGGLNVADRYDYHLSSLNFALSPDLTVSESDSLYPNADIVWRGDPPGDRGQQIGALFQEAAARADAGITGSQHIVADVTLVRFHGLTERTRYSVGGIYDVVFDLTVRDAAGNVIEGPRRVEAQLAGPGGQAALELERSGLTERVRVVDFLSQVLVSELN